MAPQQNNITSSTTAVSSDTVDDLFVTVPVLTVSEELPAQPEMKTMTDTTPQKPRKTCAFSSRWARTMECIKAPMLRLLVKTSHYAAQHPKTCVSLIIVLSIALFCIGITTNFTVRSLALCVNERLNDTVSISLTWHLTTNII